MFYQYHNKDTRLFNYDKNLEYFATALSWRSLKVTYNEAVHDQPHFTARLDKAEACWREFLLGQRQHIEPYETHLLFIENELGRGGFRVNEWYTTRSTDSTLGVSKDVAFSYSLLPRMAIVTSIHPTAMIGWQGTSIKSSGKIATGQRVTDKLFLEFMAKRAAVALGYTHGPSIEESRRRWKKACENNLPKVLESKTIELITKNEDEKKEMLMKYRRMPRTITELVRVIIKSNSISGKSTVENKSNDYLTRQFADILARLPKKDADWVDYEIKKIIAMSGRGRSHGEGLIKTSCIWIVFMVNHSATKKAQQKKNSDMIDNLQLEQTGGEIPIVVVSVNMRDGERSYELGFKY